MTFSVYLPPQARAHAVPVVYWLSGLTCTDENFVTKAGAQRAAAALARPWWLRIRAPRGDGVPDDLEGAYDFGLGAGFYLNATGGALRPTTTWPTMWKRSSRWCWRPFPELDQSREAISGHSMGGHGALTIALRNPSRFRSVSAFCPDLLPLPGALGVRRPFVGIPGEDRSIWRATTPGAAREAPSRRLCASTRALPMLFSKPSCGQNC